MHFHALRIPRLYQPVLNHVTLEQHMQAFLQQGITFQTRAGLCRDGLLQPITINDSS